MSKSPSILVILTSHARLGETEKPTGFWFEELAAPYYELLEAGARVDLASPAGGRPPADPGSVIDSPPVVKRFLDDPVAAEKLEHTLRLDTIVDDYDAYFVAGGHGAMWDLASDPVVARLLGAAVDRGKIVATVCHGAAALVTAKRKDGTSIVRGQRVAGFSDEEERAVHLTDTVPFSIEKKLGELGGKYERAPMWSSFVVRDGALVTGQNPQSSIATAREVLAALGVRAARAQAGRGA